MSNNNNNWKRIGGFSRTGTQNYVRTNDAAMGGTTFGGSTDVSYNTGNTTFRIGNNAGVIFINGDIDMSGGPTVGAPINRIRNVRDPIAEQDVATKFYVDKVVNAITLVQPENVGPTGPQGPPGVGFAGQNGSDGATGPTGCTGARGPPGSVIGVVGPTGSSGAPGPTGATGAAGVTGPVGPIGAKGDQGTQGIQGIQGSNGTILWLNPDGNSKVNELITDSYMLSTVPINSRMRTIGPISVSATYGNTNKMIPGSRFWNTAQEVSTLAVIPSGVWVLNIYANVPSNSDANQVALYAAVFMITGTESQPSPDSLIIETKDGGDAGFYPPRAAYLPDHVKYIGQSWTASDNILPNTGTNAGAVVDSTTRKLYKIQMPVEFTTLKDASGNSENVYVQLQIYIKNTKEANQTANVSMYFQTDPTTSETTYSYLQTTFGAVGIRGIQGTTGPAGLAGATGATGGAGLPGSTGSAGPTGTTGPLGPRGPIGATGPTGPAGQSNSYGPQYGVQYRANPAPQGASDPNGNFGGDTNFRYIPTGYSSRLSDATAGSVVLNDLACKSIHSPVYVEDPSITTNGATRPRTFITGGEQTSGVGGGYIVFASGKDTVNGGATNTPATVADITHGIKVVHNITSDPPTATIILHNGSKASNNVGMKFDLTNGNVASAQDKFCIVNTNGAVGVGGLTAAEMTENAQSGLNRRLHVAGNVMVGTHPGASTTAPSAMVLLNQATPTPTAPSASYPGVYHRMIKDTEMTALGDVTNGIIADAAGLGVISPNFITFQTGSALASNSLVINQAGDVSVIGRANLNGPVSVGKNFAAVTSHDGVPPIMDINGTVNISRSTATSYDNDQPRIKVISSVINKNADIPSTVSGSTANEIRGVNNNVDSGFLRLTAQSPMNSCIDLIGSIESGSGSNYNNSVRISTGTVNRMIVNGSGNVGIGTMTPGVRLDVVGGAARVNSGATTSIALTTMGLVGINLSNPTVPLDVAGAAKITGQLDMNSNKIVQLLNPTSNQDAATKSYVDTKFTTVPTPTNTNDAANKGYVDTATTNMATTSSVSTVITTAITTALGASGTQENRPTVQRGDTTNETHYLTYINGSDIPGDGSSKRALMRCDGGLTYNPNTNTLTADRFSGNCLGTAVAINAPTNSSTYIATNGSTRMFVDTAGFVGIGTTSPQNKLDIDAGSSGGIRISSTGATSIYMKSTTNNNNRPELELGTDDNNSYIMTRYDTPVRFITNSVERIRITSDGKVGIGTASPSCSLHVSGSSSLNMNVGTRVYYAKTGGSGTYSPDSQTFPISIISEQHIWIKGDILWITSDQRIKTNIVNLNADKMINVFRNLRPISFDFIDPMKNSNKKHFGFIAQEVNEVLPEGISLNTDVIPNNMIKANIAKPSETYETQCFTLKPDDTDIALQYLLLTTDTPLIFDISNSYTSTNIYKFKIYGGKEWAKEQDIYIRSEYNVTDDKYTYVIGMKKEAYDNVLTESTLFVYGQYVYDLHILDHDTIYTVATAALQEVDRQQQADKARIAELEATVATQQSLINDILERLKALERA